MSPNIYITIFSHKVNVDIFNPKKCERKLESTVTFLVSMWEPQSPRYTWIIDLTSQDLEFHTMMDQQFSYRSMDSFQSMR